MSHITPWQDPVSFRVFRYDSRPDNCLVRCYLFRMYDLKQGKEQSSPDMLIFCRSVGQKSMRMLSIYRICICPQDVCVCGLSSVFGVKTLYFLAVATWGNFIKATSNIFVKLKSDFFFLRRSEEMIGYSALVACDDVLLGWRFRTFRKSVPQISCVKMFHTSYCSKLRRFSSRHWRLLTQRHIPLDRTLKTVLLVCEVVTNCYRRGASHLCSLFMYIIIIIIWLWEAWRRKSLLQ